MRCFICVVVYGFIFMFVSIPHVKANRQKWNVRLNKRKRLRASDIGFQYGSGIHNADAQWYAYSFYKSIITSHKQYASSAGTHFFGRVQKLRNCVLVHRPMMEIRCRKFSRVHKHTHKRITDKAAHQKKINRLSVRVICDNFYLFSFLFCFYGFQRQMLNWFFTTNSSSNTAQLNA